MKTTAWKFPVPYPIKSGPSVFAFDPGLMTGFALYDGKSLFAGEAECDDALVIARDAIVLSPSPPVVVVESFTITSQTAKNSPAPWSLESIGVLRFLAKRRGCELVQQQPSDAKKFVTPVRLKHIGWYKSTPGGHTNDGLRHLYLHLVNSGRMRPPPGVV